MKSYLINRRTVIASLVILIAVIVLLVILNHTIVRG